MSVDQFLNYWNILRSIDRDELDGTVAQLNDVQWRHFYDNPVAYLVMQHPTVQQAIWAVVEARAADKGAG